VPDPDWFVSMVPAIFPISLGVNALVTILIVYRIITVYNDIRRLNSNVQTTTGSLVSVHGNGQRNLNPLISILIESGLITFVAQLTQSIMFEYAYVAFPLAGTSTVVMLFVSASCRFLIWYLNDIYLLYREFRRQLSLCVLRWAFPMIIIHQLEGLRIRSAQYSCGSSM
jgi:hypothetical protein